MLKDLKLSTKISLGFGVLIVVALVLGGAGWLSVRGMSRNLHRLHAGNECLDAINATGSLRRDFAIHGFTKHDGKEKNAAEQWAESYENFSSKLSHLAQLKGLKGKYRELAGKGAKSARRYKEAFEAQKESRRAKDDAFAQWGRIGREVTAYLAKLDTDRIGSLRQDFIEPFLLLRVSAVYLLATDGRKQWDDFRNEVQEVRSGLAHWRQSVPRNPTTASVSDKLNLFIDQYVAAGDQYWAAVEQKNEADARMATEASSIVADIAAIDKGLERDMESLAAATNTTVAVITLIAVILGILLSVVITRSIVKPINAVIEGLSAGSDQVASASEQLSSTSQQMSQGASEQASSLEEISSSLEEMSSMTKQNAGNSKQAKIMAGETSDSAKQGKQRMERMSGAITRIKASSDETAKIVKTIDEIAMQTNLLALNAAVEAARAGEAGRGFAVVAEEVRNLAQRSADAAKNTANLIAESQRNAEEGVEATGEVNEILEDIAAKVQKVDELFTEVSAASDEQSQGIDQVNTAVAQMDTVSQQNAANSEESASAGEELSSQAQQLNAMVAELTGIVKGSDNKAGPTHSPVGGNRSSAPDNGKSFGRFGSMLSSPRKSTPSLASAVKAGGNKGNGNGRHEDKATVESGETIPLDDDATLKEF